MLRYTAIAAIPLALAISAPAYTTQRVQTPSEMQMGKGLENIHEVRGGLRTLLSSQMASQSYGGNLKISESGFGKIYHDWVRFPSFEKGRIEHIMSTYLTARDARLASFTLFIDNINIQGIYSNPSEIIFFDRDYDEQKGHKGHNTLKTDTIVTDYNINRLLVSMFRITEYIINTNPRQIVQGELDNLINQLEADKSRLDVPPTNLSSLLMQR